MIIASMVVKAEKDKAENIALQLKRIPNISTHGIYKDENIIVVIEAEKEEELENLARYIMNEFDGIIGTFPTFMASDDDLDEQNIN
jgi:nitrate reductase NapAB chaperone NapD